MSGQMTLAEEPGLSWKRKEKKRKSVLREMDRMIPWERLVNVIAPCYSQKRALGGGRPQQAHAAGMDATDPFPATVVRVFGSGHGRSAVRDPGTAPV